jgi:hypothetical protein
MFEIFWTVRSLRPRSITLFRSTQSDTELRSSTMIRQSGLRRRARTPRQCARFGAHPRILDATSSIWCGWRSSPKHSMRASAIPGGRDDRLKSIVARAAQSYPSAYPASAGIWGRFNALAADHVSPEIDLVIANPGELDHCDGGGASPSAEPPPRGQPWRPPCTR